MNISQKPRMGTGLVDWTGKFTTPVKDQVKVLIFIAKFSLLIPLYSQGYCGSCWAFSATEQIESDAMRTLGATYLLSTEQITQCTKSGFGCDGGWTEAAYSYVHNAGGIETEENYPYTSNYGITGACKAISNKFVITVTGFQALT